MAVLNEAEQRFAAYLDTHGYTWSHEPDYQAELVLPTRPATNPDFLVARGRLRAVFEVRQFETTAIRDALAMSGGYMSTGPKEVYKSLWTIPGSTETGLSGSLTQEIKKMRERDLPYR